MWTITRPVTLGDRTVTVRELTVTEIRGWLSEGPATDRPLDLVLDLLLFDGLAAEDLLRFTDLARAELTELPPSALAKVAAVVKEVNSVFFHQYLPALTRLRDAVPPEPSGTPSIAPSAS